MVYSSYSKEERNAPTGENPFPAGGLPISKAFPTQTAPATEEKAQRHHVIGFYARYGKRMFDILLVFIAAPAWLPLTVLLAVGAMLDGGRPLFFQSRIGRNGKVFRIVKLRSMVVGADKKLVDYLASNPEAKAEWDEKQKLLNDPRITTYGKFIRRTSLDELPQLWNVLRGEMSIVGPRPVTAVELKRYGSRVEFYQSMRPGITGMWQVYGRNDVSYDERIALDVEYTRRASLFVDIKMVLLTVPVVLRLTGR
ncbi:MAG: sugar transferase [Fuscovulum sp.]|nr:MAG: sugar transferase [Fuscovulum sp.]